MEGGRGSARLRRDAPYQLEMRAREPSLAMDSPQPPLADGAPAAELMLGDQHLDGHSRGDDDVARVKEFVHAKVI